jgi:hypothetical protein
MAKTKSKLNDQKEAVIEEQILKENPDGFADELQPQVQIVATMPKMERILFRNDRDPGHALEFHFRSKTHPMHHYKLCHGKEYTLPVEIIEHLENRKIPLYAYRKGDDGHPQMYVSGYKHQFTCKTVRDPFLAK